jgi:NADPH2:quinone reductase
MRALVLPSLGDLDALDVGDVPPPEAGGRVLVEVAAAGLGFPDVLVAQGRYQIQPALPFVPGMEVTGTVRSAPAGCPLRPGQRVSALTGVGGACAELVAVPPAHAYPVPDGLDVPEAACLVVNYHSAYFALVRRARLRPGETVLVHGAGGGLGQAVIQVARALEASVVAVAGSDRTRAAARAAGAGEVLAAQDGWAQRARELTGGRGVDVVVDPVGGDRFDDSVRILAPEGRLVVVGFASGGIPVVRVNRLLLRNVSVLGAAWREFVTDVDPAYGGHIAGELDGMVRRGLLRPRPGAVYPLRRGGEALRAIADRRVDGRVVLTIHPET